MGSRWKGSIEPGAMPGLHQYFGTPVTTWILNRLYGSTTSPTSTAACGASPATRSSAWTCTRSRGSTPRRWCSSRCTWSLRTAEVPVTFLKDREGRLSHHKRVGLVLAVLGGVDQPARDVRLRLGLLPVQAGHRAHGPRPPADAAASASATSTSAPSTLSLNWQFLGVDDPRGRPPGVPAGLHRPGAVRLHGPRNSQRWLRVFPYTRTVLIAFGLGRARRRARACRSSSTYVDQRLRARRVPTRSRTTSR